MQREIDRLMLLVHMYSTERDAAVAFAEDEAAVRRARDRAEAEAATARAVAAAIAERDEALAVLAQARDATREAAAEAMRRAGERESLHDEATHLRRMLADAEARAATEATRSAQAAAAHSAQRDAWATEKRRLTVAVERLSEKLTALLQSTQADAADVRRSEAFARLQREADGLRRDAETRKAAAEATEKALRALQAQVAAGERALAAARAAAAQPPAQDGAQLPQLQAALALGASQRDALQQEVQRLLASNAQQSMRAEDAERRVRELASLASGWDGAGGDNGQ